MRGAASGGCRALAGGASLAGLDLDYSGLRGYGSRSVADRFALSGYLRNALWVIVTVVVSFWVGVLFDKVFSEWGNLEYIKLLIDTAIAVGTVGAVIVALAQSAQGRRESQAIAYRDAAVRHLQSAVDDFLADRLANGRPKNTRRHWLNFARAIAVARRLASRIGVAEQRELWAEQEHILRERVYDVLQPIGPSYPVDYYRDTPTIAGMDGLPLAEQSLVVVYGWVTWPKDRPDPIDRRTRFSEEQRDLMRSFGPNGLATFIDGLRPPGSHQIEPEGER